MTVVIHHHLSYRDLFVTVVVPRNWDCDQLWKVLLPIESSMKPVYWYDAGIQDNKDGG